jgi:hypothetical protein
VPCVADESCLGEFLVDCFVLSVGIALLVAELNHQPHVFDLEQPLLLVGDERYRLALPAGSPHNAVVKRCGAAYLAPIEPRGPQLSSRARATSGAVGLQLQIVVLAFTGRESNPLDRFERFQIKFSSTLLDLCWRYRDELPTLHWITSSAVAGNVSAILRLISVLLDHVHGVPQALAHSIERDRKRGDLVVTGFDVGLDAFVSHAHGVGHRRHLLDRCDHEIVQQDIQDQYDERENRNQNAQKRDIGVVASLF